MSTQSFVGKFLALQSSSGILLIAGTLFAMLMKNSSLSDWYQNILLLPIGIHFGGATLDKPFLLWINDGFMAVFFLIIGLEIKRELVEGHLKTATQRTLPLIAAVGGVVIPALIYISFNWDNELSRHGWAIPTATDIAFALAVLSLVGRHVPISLKIFLMALAVFDDFIAILIVAIFYTAELSMTALSLSWVGVFILAVLNRVGVNRIAPYILTGIFIWVCVLKSGVHATLAGMITGLFIPLNSSSSEAKSPSKHLIHILHPWVILAILPLFAFANTGIAFDGFQVDKLTQSIPIGIMVALILGKQVGVFGFCWLAIQCKLAKLPENVNWLQLYGVAILCGIGFTMSLFIGSLAFEYGGAGDARADRVGILIGSFISALWGYWVLKRSLKESDSLSSY